jgi:5S rRNA maturation endonuclease (ribonuclease M5)
MNLRIEKCFILVVEGKDDQAVVELLLNHSNLVGPSMMLEW